MNASPQYIPVAKQSNLPSKFTILATTILLIFALIIWFSYNYSKTTHSLDVYFIIAFVTLVVILLLFRLPYSTTKYIVPLTILIAIGIAYAYKYRKEEKSGTEKQQNWIYLALVCVIFVFIIALFVPTGMQIWISLGAILIGILSILFMLNEINVPYLVFGLVGITIIAVGIWLKTYTNINLDVNRTIVSCLALLTIAVLMYQFYDVIVGNATARVPLLIAFGLVFLVLGGIFVQSTLGEFVSKSVSSAPVVPKMAMYAIAMVVTVALAIGVFVSPTETWLLTGLSLMASLLLVFVLGFTPLGLGTFIVIAGIVMGSDANSMSKHAIWPINLAILLCGAIVAAFKLPVSGASAPTIIGGLFGILFSTMMVTQQSNNLILPTLLSIVSGGLMYSGVKNYRSAMGIIDILLGLGFGGYALWQSNVDKNATKHPFESPTDLTRIINAGVIITMSAFGWILTPSISKYERKSSLEWFLPLFLFISLILIIGMIIMPSVVMEHLGVTSMSLWIGLLTVLGIVICSFVAGGDIALSTFKILGISALIALGSYALYKNVINSYVFPDNNYLSIALTISVVSAAVFFGYNKGVPQWAKTPQVTTPVIVLVTLLGLWLAYYHTPQISLSVYRKGGTQVVGNTPISLSSPTYFALGEHNLNTNILFDLFLDASPVRQETTLVKVGNDIQMKYDPITNALTFYNSDQLLFVARDVPMFQKWNSFEFKFNSGNFDVKMNSNLIGQTGRVLDSIAHTDLVIGNAELNGKCRNVWVR